MTWKSSTSEPEEDTAQRAETIVSASVESGALFEVCEVATSTRLIDDQEEDCVQEFAHRGCTCDKGPNKSHCCLLFSRTLPLHESSCCRAEPQ